jgi:hypothetical protein
MHPFNLRCAICRFLRFWPLFAAEIASDGDALAHSGDVWLSVL